MENFLKIKTVLYGCFALFLLIVCWCNGLIDSHFLFALQFGFAVWVLWVVTIISTLFIMKRKIKS